MEHREFRVGLEFWLNDRQWRCTDVGSRVVVAIRVDAGEVGFLKDGRVTTDTVTRAEAAASGLFEGPPYRVNEYVFDEIDVVACSPERFVP